jgi:hypothetical protein
MFISLYTLAVKSKSIVLNNFQVVTMSPLRQTAAILVVVAIFSFAAGIPPQPEEAKSEIDNTIPQVRGKPLYR